MLTVTGTAEFTFDNGLTGLRVRVVVQPHVPQEHDVLKEISKSYAGLPMDHGQLILDRVFFIPQNDLVKDLGQTPSSLPSDATSANKFSGDGSDMGREIEHQG